MSMSTFCGDILFVYPAKRFRISLIGLSFSLVKLILFCYGFYQNILGFDGKEKSMNVSTAVIAISSLSFFAMKILISLINVLRQKATFKFFQSLSEFDNDLRKLNIKVPNSFLVPFVFWLIKIVLLEITTHTNQIGVLITLVLYFFVDYYFAIIFMIIKKIEAIEQTLR